MVTRSAFRAGIILEELHYTWASLQCQFIVHHGFLICGNAKLLAADLRRFASEGLPCRTRRVFHDLLCELIDGAKSSSRI